MGKIEIFSAIDWLDSFAHPTQIEYIIKEIVSIIRLFMSKFSRMIMSVSSSNLITN